MLNQIYKGTKTIHSSACVSRYAIMWRLLLVVLLARCARGVDIIWGECGYNESIVTIYEPPALYPGFNLTLMNTYGYCNGTVFSPAYLLFVLAESASTLSLLECFHDRNGQFDRAGDTLSCAEELGNTTLQEYFALITSETDGFTVTTVTDIMLQPLTCTSIALTEGPQTLTMAVQYRCAHQDDSPIRASTCSEETTIASPTHAWIGTTVSNTTSITFGECEGLIIQPTVLWYLANYPSPFILTAEILDTYQVLLDCARAAINYTMTTTNTLLPDTVVCDDAFRYMLLHQPQPDGSVGYIVNTTALVSCHYVCASSGTSTTAELIGIIVGTILTLAVLILAGGLLYTQYQTRYTSFNPLW